MSKKKVEKKKEKKKEMGSSMKWWMTGMMVFILVGNGFLGYYLDKTQNDSKIWDKLVSRQDRSVELDPAYLQFKGGEMVRASFVLEVEKMTEKEKKEFKKDAHVYIDEWIKKASRSEEVEWVANEKGFESAAKAIGEEKGWTVKEMYAKEYIENASP